MKEKNLLLMESAAYALAKLGTEPEYSAKHIFWELEADPAIGCRIPGEDEGGSQLRKRLRHLGSITGRDYSSCTSYMDVVSGILLDWDMVRNKEETYYVALDILSMIKDEDPR